MYNSITTLDLYSVFCVQNLKSSFCPSPSIPTKPSTPFPHCNHHTVLHVHEFFCYFLLYPSMPWGPPTVRMPTFFFFNYILLIMLLQSQFSPLCLLPSSTPNSLRQSPHHCSCPWVTHRFFGYSISYTVCYIPMAILSVPCTS